MLTHAARAAASRTKGSGQGKKLDKRRRSWRGKFSKSGMSDELMTFDFVKPARLHFARTASAALIEEIRDAHRPSMEAL